MLQRLSDFELGFIEPNFPHKKAPEGQDAEMGEKVSCDEREISKGRDVMAKTGLDCGGKERPWVAGMGEGAVG